MNEKTQKEREVRYYTEKEYIKLYGSLPEGEEAKNTAGAYNSAPKDRAKDPYWKPQKDVLGFTNGYITIFKGNTYAYKEYGKYKISNFCFDFATDFNALGLAVVCKDGKITWLNTKFQYLNPKTEEFIPLTKNNFDGYCYLSNLNKEKIGSAKKEYYDDETELDVGYATHKEAVRSLRRK